MKYYLNIFIVSSAVGFIGWRVIAWTADFVSSGGPALVWSQMYNDGGKR